MIVNKPWGSYEILDEFEYDKDTQIKVKRLIIAPGQMISLQIHEERDEMWIIKQGEGIFIRKNWKNEDIVKEVSRNDILVIPKYHEHRIINTDIRDIEILEIQHGICKENDIKLVLFMIMCEASIDEIEKANNND